MTLPRSDALHPRHVRVSTSALLDDAVVASVKVVTAKPESVGPGYAWPRAPCSALVSLLLGPGAGLCIIPVDSSS